MLNTTQTPSLNDILNVTTPRTPTSGVRGVFSSLLGGVGNIMFPGLGSILGGAISGASLGAATPTLGDQSTQFLQLQNQIQQESLAYETMSTVLKSRYDASHEAIQNMKT